MSRLLFFVVFLIFVSGSSGCGTTKWSDTSRTATEQLLLSYAIDNAVEQINFSVLADRKVYVSSDAISGTTDNKYISTAVRQHIATYGGLLCDTKEEAEFIVELRAGAVGTDRNDLLYGVPAFTIPSLTIGSNTTGMGATIPEIPFVKRTDQRAVCKIAVFAYHRETGAPVWCSGNRQSEGRAKAWWVFGAGPINRGNIYNGTEFAGGSFKEVVLAVDDGDYNENPPPLAQERFFVQPQEKTGITANETPEAKTNEPSETPPKPEQKISRYGGIPTVQ